MKNIEEKEFTVIEKKDGNAKFISRGDKVEEK